jgi:hypothetical protein
MSVDLTPLLLALPLVALILSAAGLVLDARERREGRR